MSAKIIINKKFKELIPPLRVDEKENLRQSLIRDGQLHPLVVWKEKSILVDGHHRYEILSSLGLKAKVELKSFPNETSVIEWIVLLQLSRRNISNFARFELCKYLIPIFEAKAKENQATSSGGSKPQPLQNSGKAGPIHTTKEISKISGISTDSISRAKYVDEHATNEIKELLRSGDTSLNLAYHETKRLQQKKVSKPTLKKSNTLKHRYKFRIFDGDANQGMAELDDRSIDTLVTSPPYFQLRSSLPPNSKRKKLELGNEASVGAYIQSLLALFENIQAKMKKTGTLFINLGDNYNKKNKSLHGIPWRFALGMMDMGYILRSDMIWNKLNGSPEPVKDRPVGSHEYFFMFSLEKTYYFDDTAFRIPYEGDGSYRTPAGLHSGTSKHQKVNNFKGLRPTVIPSSSEGKMRRSVLSSPTVGNQSNHHSAYPDELIAPLIMAACPEGGLVVDPFTGGGTTGRVALKNGRRFWGSELNPKFVKSAMAELKSFGVSVKSTAELIGSP